MATVVELNGPLVFTNCKLTISENVGTNDLKLLRLITNQLQFKIIGFDPLVIEKDSPSQQDVDNLFDALNEFLMVQDADASVFVSDVIEDTGKNNEHGIIEENIMISSSSSVQTSCRKEPEADKQLTKHVKEKDSGDPCTDKLSSQQTLSTDGNIHHLTNIGQHLQLNNVTQDQHLAEKLSDQNSLSCVKNLSNSEKISSVDNISSVENILTRHESEQAAQNKTTYSFVTSVQSLQKENDTNSFKENIKTKSFANETNRKDDNTSTKAMITEENKFEMKRNSATNYLEFRGSEKGESTSSYFPAVQLPKSEYKHDGSTSSLYDKRLQHLKNSYYSMPQAGASGYDKPQNDNFIVTDRSNLGVKVYKAKLQVDCIVNAANKRLQHFGGDSIAEAAGLSLTKEYEDFIKDGNTVEVTINFVSTGGELPAKFVMHTVRFKWDSYDDKSKPQCLRDLRQTVLRCFVEASRHGMTSIGLPSFSAAIFKVPKEECAQCYMKAVKHFDVISHEEKYSLREIHFVDVDTTMVKLIRECFSRRFFKPYDPLVLQKDREFAKEHWHSASRNETSNQQKKLGLQSTFSNHNILGSSTPSMGKSARKPEMSETYKIDNITLTVDIKPAFDHLADAIITIGKPFDKLSGLYDYSVQYTTKQLQKNIFEIVSVSKPGGKASRLVLVVYPEPDDPDKMKDAFENLQTAIENFDQKLTRLILTSSVLFAEPANKQHQKGKRSIDFKTVGRFSQCLFDYLKKSKTQKNISSVVVVGSEDAVSAIKKILETRDLVKMKIVPGGAGTSVDPRIACRICFGNKPCFSVPCCGGLMCRDCEQRVSSCPFCRKIWRPLIGNQPDGFMGVIMINNPCPGYENVPTWKITYFFPSGVQQKCHPNPGKPYNSAQRTAYLPACDKSFRVLLHLRLAFIRKLTFTIGHSATSNIEDTIVWNDIHHKTRIHGQSSGYPDPGYFQRVTGELASKGVFIENITEAEQHLINHFISIISTYAKFTDN